MNSLGIFYDVSLKKSNDLMDVFEQALSKTNNLMETMDNYNSFKFKEKNNNNKEQEKINNNDNKLRKVRKFKTFNQRQFKKFPLNPINNSNKYFKIRQPYNYQKEYENELIDQIEELFNPNYKKDSKENSGMLSFISPLINANLKIKNKEKYLSKERINKRKTNLNIKNENIDISNKQSNNQNNIGVNNDFNIKKINEKEPRMLKGKKSFREEIKNNKQWTKKEFRPINKDKTNAIKEIYFRAKKNGSKSNVDLLINRLKKKYS